MFDVAARALGSDRGQAGLVVATVVVAAVVLVDRWLTGEPFARCLRALGLQAPQLRSLVAALVICGLLLGSLWVYSILAGGRLQWAPEAASWIPGLFAQAGIAEEVLFRGLLFRLVRPGRTFWRAALLASGPFVVAHLYLFARMPWSLALASVGLAAVFAFPMAYLYELGGRSIWGPALVHFVAQATPKVLVLEGLPPAFPLLWIGALCVVPWAAFAVPRATRL